jgi:HAD superfamily hydrolase (TIGR01549 family)
MIMLGIEEITMPVCEENMPSISKIAVKAIILDQGNTLIMDPFQAVMRRQKAVFVETCRKYGVSLTSDTLIEQWRKSNSEIDYPFLGHFCQEEPIVQDVLRNFGVKANRAALLALELLMQYRIGLREVISSAPRTSEVRDTLREFRKRGKLLGVFSNDRIVALEFVLYSMRIRSLFQYCQASESIGIEKPDPAVFQRILNRFGLKADQLVYVGDDPVRDIAPAKSAGFRAIQYKVDTRKYNEPWRDYAPSQGIRPDATIGKFSELLEVIE